MNVPKVIFLVDDDKDDLDFFIEALKEIDDSIICIRASNGEEALKKLKEWVVPFPNFIFLDLNLPRINGKKCLIEIKKQKKFDQIPVIIYSTSSEKRIMEEMSDLGAAYFIVKPNNLSELCDSLRYVVTKNWLARQVTVEK